MHAQLAQLAMSVGDHDGAAQHADIAVPILRRLHADDDARALLLIRFMNTLLGGDPDAAEAMLVELEAESADPRLGSQMAMMPARAELALARGDVGGGLRFFDEALTSVAPVEGLEFDGLSPWVLLAASASLVARVRYGSTPADRRRAVELRDLLVEQHLEHSDGGDLPYLDFPLNGVLVAAVGRLGGVRGDARTPRGRRTPARDRRPVGLQPQLPGDVLGAR